MLVIEYNGQKIQFPASADVEQYLLSIHKNNDENIQVDGKKDRVSDLTSNTNEIAEVKHAGEKLKFVKNKFTNGKIEL